MKKTLTILIIIFCFSFAVKAQYVNIPDSNFGKFLIAKYPSCLYKDSVANKYWMDTTCSAVVNEDSVSYGTIIHADMIANLEGIQYFKKLIYLNCNTNELSSLPLLSNSLRVLYISKNYFVNPPILPDSLQVFHCAMNLLTTLPTLPNSITELNCSFNLLTSLPNLPESLLNLNVFKNNINCLPKLPKWLSILEADTSSIKCLPNIPSNLTTTLPICNSSYNPNNCSITPANYVNIPDTNFGKFLIAKYPNCLYKDTSNKYWMDTTCGAVVNEKNMGIGSNWQMFNLIGLEYFKSLNSLVISGLPNLNSFPKISNTVNYLDIESCPITSITTKLPDSLVNLLIYDVPLDTLPSFPKNLKVFKNYTFSALDWEFPWLLPPNYRPLTLKSLPALPDSLEELSVYATGLASLPTLPNRLKILNIKSPLLTTLQSPLPSNLQSLGIFSNPINCLPSLPSSLTYFSINLANSPLKCLPNSVFLNTFYDGVQFYYSSSTSLPVCNSNYNPNNCSIFNPYVNIPDTNFGKFLIAKYPSCLYKDSAANKYWMDTTCGAVVNETSLDCSSHKIANLEGIEYFKNLGSLNCNDNKITSLYSLPNKLVHFDCSFNQLSTLTQLPDSLNFLICSGNLITNLPTLPKTLYQLYCDRNKLISLPKIPELLEDLSCSYNQITSLDTIGKMKHLQLFNCSHNLLTNLPNIDSIGFYPPRYVINCGPQIYLFGNNIHCLPRIPEPYLNSSQLCGIMLSFDTSMIKCIPNYVVNSSGISFFDSSNHQLLNFPICNPTNNPNQCHIYPSVSGKVFTDNNSNAVKDTSEFYRPFVKFSLNNGQYTYSNLQGAYGISVDTLGSYTLKVTPPPYFKAVPDSVNINFTAATTSVILPNISLQPITTIDSFAIKITSLNRPRPGFKFAYNVSYGNVGTVSSTTDNIIPIHYDTSKLHFDSASVAITTTGSFAPIEVNAGKLIAGQGGSFNLYFTVKPTAAIGDNIIAHADIIFSGTKEFDTDSAVVVGSYDPNDKQATPTLTPQQVQNGNYIDYTIRFQNTGNAAAINIVIADTLSSLLQFNNIQIVSSSHNSNISYKVGNGIIYFEFLNINLPDSAANEPLSHGFVNFRVKALPTLASGAIVPNTAHIYFDYNAPIVTNTATTQIKAIVTPVRIITYSVSLNDKLETRNLWTVGVEVNVSHYVVQRSINGKDFISVGEVAAQGLNSYSFTNKLPTNYSLLTTIYYRLKIVDKDGKISYSEIRKLTTNNYQLSTINIYPNPAKNVATINVEGGKELLIIDYLGKQVYQANINRTSYIVHLKSFTKGIYLVKMIMNNGEVKTSKLIIE